MGSDQVSPAKLVGELKWRLAENKTLNLSATNLQSRHINLGRFSPTGGSLQEDFQGYTRVDASFRYRTRHRGTWSLGVENLFNQYYLQAIDSSAVVSSASPPYFFAGRGRMLSLSNSLRF